MHGGFGGHGHSGHGGGHHGGHSSAPAHHQSASHAPLSHSGQGHHGHGILSGIAHFFDKHHHHHHHAAGQHPSQSVSWNMPLQVEKGEQRTLSPQTKAAIAAFAFFGSMVAWLFVIYYLHHRDHPHYLSTKAEWSRSMLSTRKASSPGEPAAQPAQSGEPAQAPVAQQAPAYPGQFGMNLSPSAVSSVSPFGAPRSDADSPVAGGAAISPLSQRPALPYQPAAYAQPAIQQPAPAGFGAAASGVTPAAAYSYPAASNRPASHEGGSGRSLRLESAGNPCSYGAFYPASQYAAGQALLMGRQNHALGPRRKIVVQR